MHWSSQNQSKNGKKISDEKKWPNFNTHFKSAQTTYKKACPVDTTAQHGYTNESNILVEQVLQENETRNQHEADFAEELDTHKEIEALKQQLAVLPQQESNSALDKTEMQLLMETVNSLKAQMNNQK